MNRNIYKLFLIIIGIFSVLFVYIYFHIQSERLAYKIGEMRKSMEKEKSTNTQLHLFLDQLSSPERLDKIAGNMKFSSPSKAQIIEITAETSADKKADKK